MKYEVVSLMDTGVVLVPLAGNDWLREFHTFLLFVVRKLVLLAWPWKFDNFNVRCKTVHVLVAKRITVSAFPRNIDKLRM